MRRPLTVTLLLLSIPAIGQAQSLDRLDAAERAERAARDLDSLAAYGRAADRLVATIADGDALFAADQPALSADQRRRALQLFSQVSAYSVALDRIAHYHFDFWRLDPLRDPVGHARHFFIAFSAYVELLRLDYAFIAPTLDKPVFERLLDEGSPEHDVPRGAYARMKWNVVHVEDVGELFAALQYHHFLALSLYKKLDPALNVRRARLDALLGPLAKRVGRDGAKLLVRNGLDILRDGGHRGWFPIQADVAEWLGDTKVRRLHASLVSAEQIDDAVHWSQPGDILVERRNWYLSNVGLPGFWPHAALYLGNASELSAFLDKDAEVARNYPGGFLNALRSTHPAAVAAYEAKDGEHTLRVIEAVSEGVVFTSAEHSIAADYVAALRPRLPRIEIARAIERAFGYHGRPYDFDFDFATDQSLVCSELVYKAYEPREGVRGIHWSLVDMLGRQTLPPNAMVAQFDAEHGQPGQQLDMVWFLDGHETTKGADWASAAALRASHLRPKWDVAQK